MSVQMALLAPATRVASRKLGPTAGSRCDSSLSSAAVCGDEQVGEHVRQVRHAHHQTIVGLGVDRRRDAPRSGRAAGADARRARPRCCLGRASGTTWRHRRGPRVRARRRRSRRPRADVRQRSAHRTRRRRERAWSSRRRVTTQSGPALSSAKRTVSAKRPHRRGGEHDVGPGDGACDVIGRLVDRSQGERAGANVGVRVVAADPRRCARARGQSDRAADQADAEDRDPHPLRAAPSALGQRCERVQPLPTPPAPRRSSPSRCIRR